MKLKLLFAVFLLIILSSNASALEELFDDYVYTLDTFQIDDDIFYVALANDNNVLELHKNEFDLYYIENGTCEYTTEHKYCFMGLFLDYNEYGRPIPNTMRWEPAIKVEIYSLKPELRIERTFEDEINKDDTAAITLEIENEGDKRITNIIFKELIPETATLRNRGDNMVYSNRELSWSWPILVPGDTLTISYTLAPTGYNDIELFNGTLSYIFEERPYTDEIEESTIEINSPIDFEAEIDNINVGLGEEFTYTSTIKNDDWNDRLNVNFKLSIPEYITLVQVPSFFHVSQNLEEEFSLLVGETKNIEIVMKSTYVDTYRIDQRVTSSIRDETFYNYETFEVNVTLPKPELILTSSKDEVFEGNTFTLVAKIKNSADIYFYDISGIIEGPVVGRPRPVQSSGIAPDSEKELFQEIIRAPGVKNVTEFNTTLKGSYRTPSGQFLDFETIIPITVKPASIAFNINKKLNNEKPLQGEEVTVTVKAKNIGQSFASISLVEEIPEPLEFISGLTSKTLSLNPDQEEEFYIYRIRVPLETEPGEYSLKTHLTYQDLYEITDEAVILVEKNMTEPDVDISFDNDDKKPVEKKKKNFFRKILDFFMDFFR